MPRQISLTTKNNSSLTYNPESRNVRVHDLAARSTAEIPFADLDQFVVIIKAAAAAEIRGPS